MKHIKLFPEFLFESMRATPAKETPIMQAVLASRKGNFTSPDWYTKAEIEDIKEWGDLKGIEIAESIEAPGSDGKNYFGTPDGTGLNRSRDLFLRGEGTLCNTLNLNTGEKVDTIVKRGGKFKGNRGTYSTIASALEA